MRAVSSYKFPGKFKVSVKDTEKYGVSPFVAGRHEFVTEYQMEKHLKVLSKNLEKSGLKDCKICVTQL